MPVGSLTAMDAAVVLAIGFAGGISGGLLGIGGSIVMIPLLGVALGSNQQLYQAACMIVNVVVAAGAVRRHAIAGSVRRDVVPWMLPAAGAFVIVGVLLSNVMPSRTLEVVFGAFLLWTAAAEGVRALRRVPDDPPPPPTVGRRKPVLIGSLTGLVAGLLGVGGGTVAVPLLRAIGRLPMRQAIGTSTAVMIVASAIGATLKNASLPSLVPPAGETLTIGASLMLAAILAPAALVGALVGSRLTYRLPLPAVRLAFGVLIAMAGLRMVGVARW